MRYKIDEVFYWPGFSILSWVGRSILLVAIFITLFTQNIFGAITLTVFFVLSLLILNFSKIIPPFPIFLFVLSAIMNGLVWINNLNSAYPILDDVAHLYTPFVLMLVMGYMIKDFVYNSKQKNLFLLTVVILGFLIGVIWEVYEWCLHFFVTELPLTIPDTIKDLILDSIGAFLAGITLYSLPDTKRPKA